jgi:hypothetical protein
VRFEADPPSRGHHPMPGWLGHRDQVAAEVVSLACLSTRSSAPRAGPVAV